MQAHECVHVCVSMLQGDISYKTILASESEVLLTASFLFTINRI